MNVREIFHGSLQLSHDGLLSFRKFENDVVTLTEPTIDEGFNDGAIVRANGRLMALNSNLYHCAVWQFVFRFRVDVRMQFGCLQRLAVCSVVDFLNCIDTYAL